MKNGSATTKAAWNGAREEGRSAGIIEGMQEVAKKMKEKNMPLETIIELTGLSKEEIETI